MSSIARHYSPRISRFLVSVLYHEAKSRGIPMTRLVDELLRASLLGGAGWQKASSQLLVSAEKTDTRS